MEAKSRVMESLERLKAQEKPRGYKYKPIPTTKIRSEPVKTIQHMEKKMKSDSKNYLGMYWDLIKLEKKFLAAVAELERSNIRPAELFGNEIQKRKDKIEEKHNRMQNLYKERMENL